MNFGEAQFLPTRQKNLGLLIWKLNDAGNLYYAFQKKSQKRLRDGTFSEYYECRNCIISSGNDRQVARTVVNSGIIRSDPSKGHKDECLPFTSDEIEIMKSARETGCSRKDDDRKKSALVDQVMNEEAQDQELLEDRLASAVAAQISKKAQSILQRSHSSKDIRREVVSASSIRSIEIPTNTSAGFSSSNLSIMFEVADPPDFEECVAQGKTRCLDTASYSNWNVRQFFDFPPDDIELKTIPRDNLYKESLSVPYLNSYELSSEIKDVLTSYSSDFLVVYRKYNHYSSGEIHRRKAAERSAILQTLPTQMFEVDLEDFSDNTSSSSNKLSNQQINMGSDLENTFSSEQLASLADFNHSITDPDIPGILEKISTDQIDCLNACRRAKDRQAYLFDIFPALNEADVIERRYLPPMPYEWKGHRLLLKIVSLKLDLEIEPIFASVALYDAKEKKKISENFYFDCNSDAVKGLLKGHVQYQDVSSLCKSAIFSVTHPSNDLFLVFRLEKVLQAGDLSEVIDPYLKEDKNREKLKNQCMEFCDRLGAYRMPFAWAAIDLSKIISEATGIAENADNSKLDTQTCYSGSSLLDHINQSDNESTHSAETSDRRSQSSFSGTNTLKRLDDSQLFTRNDSLRKSSNRFLMQSFDDIDKFKPLTLTVNNFIRQEADKFGDEDLFKYLAEIRRNTLLTKKPKCIPGVLKFDISPYADECVNCLSPELLRMLPFHDDELNVTKEMLEFPAKEIYVPNYTKRNLLYLSPKSMNFTSKPGSARNIVLKVQLMDGSTEVPQAFFGKSSCPAYSNFCYSSVNYHNKSPQFYDEIKMQLPLLLKDSHHLLFTFYHVSCKAKPGRENHPNALETTVGFSWLPLSVKNGELPNGEYDLPVSLDPLPDCYFYLTPDVNLPNIRWLDNHRNVFNFCILPITTVYVQDKFLDAFFKAYHILKSSGETEAKAELNEAELKQLIRNLIKAKPEPLVKFLYIVLDKLIDLILCPPVLNGLSVNVSSTCFETLGQIAKILTYLVDGFADQHSRSCLLATYLQYFNVSRCTDFDSSPPAHRTSQCINADENASENSELMQIIRGFEKSSFLATSSMQTCRRLLHEEIAALWLQNTGPSRDVACLNAWFFFELMIKSMGEYLLVPKPNRIYLKRKLRFPQHFTDDVTALVTTLTSEIITRCGKDERFAKNLNFGLAFFLRDILSLMDRTYVLVLIKTYCAKIASKLASACDLDCLLSHKLDCLRIVCSHEHYITLNLPFVSAVPSPGTETASSPHLVPIPKASGSYGCGTLKKGSCGSSVLISDSCCSSDNSTFAPYGSAAGTIHRQRPPSPSPSQSSRSSAGSATVSSSSATNGSAVAGVGLGRASLNASFRTRHFLAGLLLADLSHALDSKIASASSKCICILKDLLSAHDADTRLDDKFVRVKVAELYFPLLGIVMDAIGHLFDPYAQDMSADVCDAPPTAGLPDTNVNEGITVPQIVLINNSSSAPITNAANNSSPTCLSLEDTRNLLIGFCWVLKNADSASIFHWLTELAPLRLNQLLDVLQLCVSCFEYKGKSRHQASASHNVRKSISELGSVILGENSASKAFKMRKATKNELPDASQEEGVRWRKGRHYPDMRAKYGDFPTGDPLLESNLCTEINMIVLDVLEMIIKCATGPAPSDQPKRQPHEMALSSGYAPSISEAIIRVLLHMLSTSQSVRALQHLFATQRSLVSKFSEFLFEEAQCSNLCLQLLGHCASRLQPARAQASASLYHLLKYAYDSGSKFSRIKMQITVSLSFLVGTIAGSPTHSGSAPHLRCLDFFDETNLRRSLKRILSYAEADSMSSDCVSKSSNFAEQVKDLVFNLHMILSDTVKMKEFQNDFEMLIDLMYRIAKGYQNSPDLRLTWLQNMAQKQLDRRNFAEAAQCYVHAAALTAEYLRMLEPAADHLPEGAVSFLPLSDDVLEESAVGDDVVKPRDDEGVCVGIRFTELGLRSLLKQAACAYQEAQMQECAHQAYKLLLPGYERDRNYNKLSQIYALLAECMGKLGQVHDDKRLFGTFFRVGFYGSRFGDLDGQEFIYREPSITKLPEISHRLESFYVQKFGGDHRVVELVKDSNNVDRNLLDSRKAYLQITYVEPYFDSWELRRRQSSFERNFNVRRFVYYTPFTTRGAPRGDLREQFKRRTVLSAAHCLPYVTTRVRVADREQRICTPIEVAIEDVRRKTHELDVATRREPRDAKILQMVLQGCIGTTVNQGPLEIANVFLSQPSDLADGSESEPSQLPDLSKSRALRNKLRLAFKDFSKKCADALRENKRLIGSERREYQKELERNYVQFTERLAPILLASRLENRPTLGGVRLPGPEQSIFNAEQNSAVDDADEYASAV